MAAGHLLARRAGSLGGSGGMLPRKNLKFDVAKTAIFAFLMVRASRFSLQSSLKIDLILIIRQKTNILMTLYKCDEPLQLV